MIYAKENNYGIDNKINLIQRCLDLKLSDVWGRNVNIYGRIQDTVRDGQTIPEVYDNSKDYIQPFFNDKQAATVGFIVKSREITGQKHKANIDIVFVVLLPEIHGDNKRNDEKAIMEAYKILKRPQYTLDITGIKTGVKDVFSGYALEALTNRDMQPWHVFSFECEIDYTENIC